MPYLLLIMFFVLALGILLFSLDLFNIQKKIPAFVFHSRFTSIVTLVSVFISAVIGLYNGWITSRFGIFGTVVSLIVIALSVAIFSFLYYTRILKITRLKKYPGLSVVGIITKRKDFELEVAMLILTASMTLYLVFSVLYFLFFNSILSTSNFVVVGILCFLLLLVIFNRMSFEYRVKKGLYGRTTYEATEIIKFILEHSSDIDFTDGDRPKKVISEQDLVELQKEINAKQLGLPLPA